MLQELGDKLSPETQNLALFRIWEIIVENESGIFYKTVTSN
jgi:hypothetical protein